MEEAGLDLYNPKRRWIYCAFGAVSQDLEDEELRRAVYSSRPIWVKVIGIDWDVKETSDDANSLESG
jgi:hypothetical protein